MREVYVELKVITNNKIKTELNVVEEDKENPYDSNAMIVQLPMDDRK